MIYTSYWGNVRNLEAAGIEPVAVSRGKPKWFRGRALDCLAPTWTMVKMDDPWEYEELYMRILAKNDPHAVAKWLGDGDVALCCWERCLDDCHRKYIGSWLRRAGHDCVEFAPVEDSPQLALF